MRVVAELYGLKNCDSCRKARKWLNTNKFDFNFIDVREQPPSLSLVKKWAGQLGWQVLLNKKSKTWRELPADKQDIDDLVSACRLMHEMPLLIKRPVLTSNARTVCGFDEQTYDVFFAAE